jgi:hypothetical protein
MSAQPSAFVIEQQARLSICICHFDSHHFDRDLIALKAWLLNLPPSTRLFLKFRNCGLTDRSFDLIFDSLSRMATLICALDLSDNKLTSRSASKLIILLETCKNCQQWELSGLHLQDR